MSLIAPLVAFLAGFLTATYTGWRAAQVAAINDHLEDLRQIEELAVRYWLGTDDSVEAREATGHRLRGKLHASAVFRDKFPKILANAVKEYTSLEADLFDAATGGSFQTKDCRSDPAVAIAIMQTCNELRALIRATRTKIYIAR